MAIGVVLTAPAGSEVPEKVVAWQLWGLGDWSLVVEEFEQLSFRQLARAVILARADGNVSCEIERFIKLGRND